MRNVLEFNPERVKAEPHASDAFWGHNNGPLRDTHLATRVNEKRGAVLSKARNSSIFSNDDCDSAAAKQRDREGKWEKRHVAEVTGGKRSALLGGPEDKSSGRGGKRMSEFGNRERTSSLGAPPARGDEYVVTKGNGAGDGTVLVREGPQARSPAFGGGRFHRRNFSPVLQNKIGVDNSGGGLLGRPLRRPTNMPGPLTGPCVGDNGPRGASGFETPGSYGGPPSDNGAFPPPLHLERLQQNQQQPASYSDNIAREPLGNTVSDEGKAAVGGGMDVAEVFPDKVFPGEHSRFSPEKRGSQKDKRAQRREAPGLPSHGRRRRTKQKVTGKNYGTAGGEEEVNPAYAAQRPRAVTSASHPEMRPRVIGNYDARPDLPGYAGLTSGEVNGGLHMKEGAADLHGERGDNLEVGLRRSRHDVHVNVEQKMIEETDAAMEERVRSRIAALEDEVAQANEVNAGLNRVLAQRRGMPGAAKVVSVEGRRGVQGSREARVVAAGCRRRASGSNTMRSGADVADGNDDLPVVRYAPAANRGGRTVPKDQQRPPRPGRKDSTTSASTWQSSNRGVFRGDKEGSLAMLANGGAASTSNREPISTSKRQTRIDHLAASPENNCYSAAGARRPSSRGGGNSAAQTMRRSRNSASVPSLFKASEDNSVAIEQERGVFDAQNAVEDDAQLNEIEAAQRPFSAAVLDKVYPGGNPKQLRRSSSAQHVGRGLPSDARRLGAARAGGQPQQTRVA